MSILTQRQSFVKLLLIKQLLPQWNATWHAVIDHFRVPLCPCFKNMSCEKPFIWKWLWFAWKLTCRVNTFSHEWFRTKTAYNFVQTCPLALRDFNRKILSTFNCYRLFLKWENYNANILPLMIRFFSFLQINYRHIDKQSWNTRKPRRNYR